LLRVRGLTKTFRTKPKPVTGWAAMNPLRRPVRPVFTAVNHVSFDLARGETLGIVGESGSGKSTTVRCILRALKPDRGLAELRVTADAPPVDLATLPECDLTPLRRSMQMIFQDPFASLNPRMTVEQIVGEGLLVHGVCGRAERRERVRAMLHRVGLEPEHASRYPHAFSGGQRQRLGIARALILNPELVVADEAVSALDVSVQAQVLALLKELQAELGLTYIFVSHDLSVVQDVCDRVAVMHRGRVVELGSADQVFNRPRHAYTRVLISAVPQPDPDRPMRPLRVEDLTPEQLEPLPDIAPDDEIDPASPVLLVPTTVGP
jgi:ABC-type oligopeptide transport system ATPase subunit